MTVAAPKETELIPGYITTERIGAGGYGEVWRAEAPGGFEKAIKVVYGFHDDERATRELKALERIKRVRHPFLLSIERAEIIDGRLAILTELADMSLDQRFEEFREQGQAGIPREELLGYVRDAADALDYLLQQHKLQHLDVKPENLLLVAGHIKVADFGLVKHISERTQQSLVGGMTPSYAAPEIFDGQPSPHSDQYSLAIVYQEMLTGALPFPGRTSAQLALQHTQSRPLLTPLPEHDRPVVAKALSKTPADRFNSCLEFVEALTGSRSWKSLDSRKGPNGDEPDASAAESTAETQAIASGATECISSAGASSKDPQPPDGARHLRTEAIGQGRDSSPFTPPAQPSPEEPALRVSTAVIDAPLPDTTSPTGGFRPTLFVGIGGVGARVLALLRHKLAADDRADWSTVLPMLLLDTDRSTIQAAQNGALGGELARGEVCHVPLRRPQQYRAESPKLLNWLSRRWLYNIPRSLQTRGIRPLGRLALVDHTSRVQEALEERLGELNDHDRIDQIAQSSGVDCRSHEPRVVLIASTDGGTGGGIAVDVAFALQSLTRRLSGQGLEMLGVLNHATGRKQEQRELALANTYAALCELSTIHRMGYHGPRAPEARNACYEGDKLPFDYLYFLHWGDDLSEEQFGESVEDVADYLLWDTLSSVGATLDCCRHATSTSGEANVQDCSLRSFALSGLHLDEDAPVPKVVQPKAAEATGHTRRLMLLAPPDHRCVQGSAAFRSEESPPIAVLAAEEVPHPVLLYEAEQLSLAQAAAQLIDGRPDVIDVARRLHIRNDIAWQQPPCLELHGDMPELAHV